MILPFTREEFLENFTNYNEAVFPVQLVLYLAAFAIIILAVKRKKYSDKVISGLLSMFWIWMGIVYHLVFFTSINKAAYVFGPVFILQALLLFYYGVIKNRLSFRYTTGLYGTTGALFLLFALVLYPVLGYMQGHVYPSSPTFGLPCPTTIFTFGIFLWSANKFPLAILFIPVIWSFVGFSAAFSLGIREDTSLIIASVAATILLIVQRRKSAAKIVATPN